MSASTWREFRKYAIMLVSLFAILESARQLWIWRTCFTELLGAPCEVAGFQFEVRRLLEFSGGQCLYLDTRRRQEGSPVSI